MKKLLLVLLSILCVSVVGCSDSQKDEKAEAKEEVKEEKTSNKETIEPRKDSVTKADKKDHLLYFYYWKHEIRGFKVNIPTIHLSNKQEDGKQVVKAMFDVESFNQSEQNVYKSLKYISIEDDKGNKGTIEYVPKSNEHWYTKEPSIIAANKKNESTFSVAFNNVDHFEKIKSITISFPIQFGLEDDADSFKQWNEITFKIK